MAGEFAGGLWGDGLEGDCSGGEGVVAEDFGVGGAGGDEGFAEFAFVVLSDAGLDEVVEGGLAAGECGSVVGGGQGFDEPIRHGVCPWVCP